MAISHQAFSWAVTCSAPFMACALSLGGSREATAQDYRLDGELLIDMSMEGVTIPWARFSKLGLKAATRPGGTLRLLVANEPRVLTIMDGPACEWWQPSAQSPAFAYSSHDKLVFGHLSASGMPRYSNSLVTIPRGSVAVPVCSDNFVAAICSSSAIRVYGEDGVSAEYAWDAPPVTPSELLIDQDLVCAVLRDSLSTYRMRSGRAILLSKTIVARGRRGPVVTLDPAGRVVALDQGWVVTRSLADLHVVARARIGQLADKRVVGIGVRKDRSLLVLLEGGVLLRWLPR